MPEEIRQLEAYGVAKIFSPEDGRQLGLEGMISLMLEACDFAVTQLSDGQPPELTPAQWQPIARLISQVEAGVTPALSLPTRNVPVVGISGVGGSGKSSLTDELVRRFLADFPQLQVAILAVDPTKRRTGGALLADRIRMNALASERVYMRSLATRQAHRSLSTAVEGAIQVLKVAGFDLIFVESAGAGQADSEIADIADVALYAMTPEYGAALQLEKIEMLDFAHLVAINKFDRPGALDALREVRRQWRRVHPDFSGAEEDVPVFGTCAHQFNDAGVNALYRRLVRELESRFGQAFHLERSHAEPVGLPQRHPIIPAERSNYLREIAKTCRKAREQAQQQVAVARKLYQLVGARALLSALPGEGTFAQLWQLFEAITSGTLPPEPALADLDAEIRRLAHELLPESRNALATWPRLKEDYAGDTFTYTVREREVTVPLTSPSLAGTHIPKVVLPDSEDWGEILRFILRENVPGAYPYTAGVFPFKRQEELPTRMFAGEGGPERTNRRFHFLRAGQPFARLSTAFDSVTLYGEDPQERPDVFGKVGESGVSICTVEDMERLYAGFDLCAPHTSVSMTINGPAPMILAMFFNVAGRQEAKRRLIADGRLRGNPEDALQPTVDGKSWEEIATLLRPGEWEEALGCAVRVVRGTVQADILKEDQAQNTCIFSTEFALRLMGDIQSWFVENQVRNFYSVSISGYHIAEAGANPITQLAFTLANGFTYVEYYLARGLPVDAFAPNLSFFFSNGMDPEYTVIGRVARRIWAVAMRHRYQANERSQKLKYHIQTSGRSLHAKEIAFNDIRTTLQALLALADHCNSLHTNAYDEAITTPTEESVRRALAIQLISTLEFGLLKNENPWQGSYFVEWLTDRVEEAVLQEFDRLAERGGVLGAMETGYQRAKIQEESLHYERLKHSGELPIVGVNFFEDPRRSSYELEASQLTRASREEKNARLEHLRDFQARHRQAELWERHRNAPVPNPDLDALPPWQRPAAYALARLQQAARSGKNLFAELLDTVCVASLGQITHALYQVGGQYRRNM
ncbi:MAG: methylmalonyl-CoA mutase family protein [Thermoanaerobaculum sp.]|nr:methylmalonyl-CoA mutase family protein [Thermoanaerobaculum sp.]